MSTGESFDFDPSLFAIDWGPTTEDELALNYILRFNDRAEESGQKIVESPVEENQMWVTMPNCANEITIKTGSCDLEVGHYEPLIGEYVIYPEFVLPGEIESWQKIAADRKVDMLEKFKKLPNLHYHTWHDQDHPDVLEVLQLQKNVLVSAGVGESILVGQRMGIGHANEMFYADEYTRMQLGLSGAKLNDMLLRVVGAFNEERGLKKRFGCRYIKVAQRPADAPSYMFEPYESKVDNDELAALIVLVDEMERIKQKHPNFDAERLALKLSPSDFRKT